MIAEGKIKSQFLSAQATCNQGCDPIFVLGRAIKNMFKTSYFFGGISNLVGYVYFNITEKYEIHDKQLAKFIKKFQRKRIFYGRYK